MRDRRSSTFGLVGQIIMCVCVLPGSFRGWKPSISKQNSSI